MGNVPTGTVSFLFTDLEGSTRLWEGHPDAMKEAVALHDRLLTEIITAAGGRVFSTAGDAFAAAFWRPEDAIRAAVDAQRAMAAVDWPQGCQLRSRMGVHTGTADERDGNYFGPVLNRASRLMAAGHGGQVLVSLASEELARDALPGDIKLLDLGDHRLRDLSRAERIFQVRADGLEDDFPALDTLEVVPNNLPVQLSSFVGREQELIRVAELVRDHRLVTLTGVGGTGKTRLALQYAASAFETFPDGVHLVEFATVADPALVPERVATVLSVQQSAGSDRSPVEHLAACLRDQRMLLVLDNCEHVIEATAALAAGILRGCAQVSVLATSREALGVDGEQVFRLPSLGVPTDGDLDIGTLLGFESARLFVERALNADADFQVAATEADPLAQICRRLDGIPLAIELAAARVGSLSLRSMASRLDDQFRLLAGGRRTVVERHQTLRAAIDWSHDLLGENARVLLPRLAVFAGSWSLDGAEAVCADDVLDAGQVVDALSELVDKSIVTPIHDDFGDRYRMVEPLRQYALERLARSGETEPLRDRHADWIEARCAPTSYEDEAARRNDLESVLFTAAEFSNLVDAARWLLERGEIDRASRLLVGTFLAVMITGKYGEALELLGAAFERQGVACWVRYLGEIYAANYHVFLGEAEKALLRAEQATATGKACSEITDPYRSHIVQALIAGTVLGGLSAHAPQLEDAKAGAAANGDLISVQEAVFWRGQAAVQDGDYERGICLLREAEAPMKGLPIGYVPYCAAFIPLCKVLAGQEVADSELDEAEVVVRAAGDPFVAAWFLTARAAAGPCGRARAAVEEALRLLRRHGIGPWPCLEATAWYCEHRDDPEGVARVLGALTLFTDGLIAHHRWARSAAWARERLDEDHFRAAFDEGAQSGAESVIEDALTVQ